MNISTAPRDELYNALHYIAQGEDTPELRRSLASLCYHGVPGKHSPLKCTSKILFPQRFYLPFSRLHEQIFEIIDDDSIQQFCILAPRGFGKTSLLNLSYPARKILFRETKFHIPIGNSSTNAVLQAENLKRELLYNPMIKKLFGPMKTDNFSKEQWITSTGTMIMARGRGQAIRGLLYGDHRPQTPLGDDIEDPEEVRNEDRRRETMEWWFADVCNSINRARTDWRVGIIGTLLHEDSLLANLEEDSGWTSIRLSLCSDTYKSNWPEFISDEAMLNLVQSFRNQNKLDTFYREFMNVPSAKEDASFQAKNFKYYNESDEWFIDQLYQCENIVIGDPAKTAKMQSADSAIVGLTINLKRRMIIVRDIVAGKMYPDQFCAGVLDMAENLKRGGGLSRVVGIETISLNEWILKPFKDAMKVRGLVYNIEELKAQGSTGKVEAKDARIGALAPYYRQGWFYHNASGVCGPLEQQLMSFPRSKLRDIMDALAYIIYIMEKGKLFFSYEPTEGEMMKEDDPNDSFEEFEDVDEGDWQLIE